MHYSEKDVRGLFMKNPCGVDLLVGEDTGRFVADYGYDICLGGAPIALRAVKFQDGHYTLEANKTLIMISPDSYDIPTNMKAYVSASKAAFDCGLLVFPEQTFIANGYSGKFRYVVKNVSGERVKIVLGQPIARVVFSF